MTWYDRGIRLFANKTTAKSAATAPVTLMFGPSSNSRVMMLGEAVLHMQLPSVVPNSAKSANVEICPVLLELFERQKRR